MSLQVHLGILLIALMFLVRDFYGNVEKPTFNQSLIESIYVFCMLEVVIGIFYVCWELYEPTL